MKKSKKPYVVDLFCGIGGLTHGFILEKFKILAGIDFDANCKYAYEKNNKTKFIQGDLNAISSKSINDLYPKGSLKILVGCAPCQAFSTLSNKYRNNDKWKLLYAFSRIIKDVKPDIISMENVPNLLKYKDGAVFDDFIKVLTRRKYHITYKVINASRYGVAQHRNRLILIASKLGAVNFVKETHSEDHVVTVADVIGKLPKVKDGVSHPKDLIHRAPKLAPINKMRLAATKEGGGWKDWPEDLKLECHKKKSGKSFRAVYGRMRWDAAAPTLTTFCTGIGNGRFGHPCQDRAITLREAALLQSFPDTYQFIPSTGIFSPSIIEQQIGNAVPVKLGQMIAKSIKRHLRDHRV